MHLKFHERNLAQVYHLFHTKEIISFRKFSIAKDKRNSGEERNQEMRGALLEELLSSFTCIDEFSKPRYKPLPGDDDLKRITQHMQRMDHNIS